MYTLILASGSPRRKELLEAAGLKPQLLLSKVSEIPRESMTPEEQISDISTRKLKSALTLVQLLPGTKAIVLVADTEVVFEGRLLGKPDSPLAAERTLQKLSGKTHDVITAVSLFETAKQLEECFCIKTSITFRKISDEEIRTYVATGDPMDKAGSYGIQNIPSDFISKIDGSLTNVIGLPMEELLARFERKKWIFV